MFIADRQCQISSECGDNELGSTKEQALPSPWKLILQTQRPLKNCFYQTPVKKSKNILIAGRGGP
jgi:hypothetical protein